MKKDVGTPFIQFELSNHAVNDAANIFGFSSKNSTRYQKILAVVHFIYFSYTLIYEN